MTFKLHLLESTAARVFAADQERLVWLQRGSWEDLGKFLDAKTIEVQPSDRPTLILHSGSLRMSKERTIVIKSVSLTSLELNATVLGDSADALDAAREVWSKLGEQAGVEGEPDASPGDWVYKTIAVFTARGLLERQFPGLTLAKAALRTADPKITFDARESFRLELFAERRAHGLTAKQSFIIEPRVAAKPEDDVYYTVSPLRSEEHIRLLETLCGAR